MQELYAVQNQESSDLAKRPEAWSDGTVRNHETTIVAVSRAFVERFDT
jgi:hypothetical protein